MDSKRRTRTCEKTRRPRQETPRGCRQIVLPLDEETDRMLAADRTEARAFVEEQARTYPELFPSEMREHGFTFDGFERASRKQPGVRLRRLRVPGTNHVYTLRPSYLMPYLVGTVDELGYGLELLSHGVPPEIVARGCGHNAMFWYRVQEHLGRNSLAGTTLRASGQVPVDLAADEHHTTVNREKVFVSTTAAQGVILGLNLSMSADEVALTETYGEFRREARNIQPDYSPKSVNTDGWPATRNAWRKLFDGLTLILCFLHGFLKVYDRCRRQYQELKNRIWEVYRAASAAEFRQRMTELKTWCESQNLPPAVLTAVKKLFQHTNDYATSYSHPNGYRTSNQVDRLMNLRNRIIHAGRRLHGHLQSSEWRLRGWALMVNFRPFTQRHQYRCQWSSAAHRVNQKKTYHHHWLHNLNVSTSLAGFKA